LQHYVEHYNSIEFNATHNKVYDQATSPELTAYLVDKMNEAMGLHLIKPAFIEGGAKQKGLFD